MLTDRPAERAMRPIPAPADRGLARRAFVLGALLVSTGGALAQSSGAAGDGPAASAQGAAKGAAKAAASGDLSSAATAAAEALKGAAEAKLLIADLIGADVTGPDDRKLGTVDDLVAVPGGRIVAAVLSVEGGERLPVPFGLVKVANAADASGVSLPVTLDELRADEAIRTLADALEL